MDNNMSYNNDNENQDTAYQPNNYSSYNANAYPNINEEPLTIGEWMLTLFLLMIPCVNIILLIVWAVSNNGNVNRKRFAIASLVFAAIGIVLYFILIFTLGTAIMSNYSELYY